MKNKTVGIIGAMPEEVMGIVELLSDRQEKNRRKNLLLWTYQ